MQILLRFPEDPRHDEGSNSLGDQVDMENGTCGFSSDISNKAIGIGYTAAGTIFIPLHLICSWLMWRDKDMRSPTYQFMINLSIADSLELIPLGLYAGIAILIRIEQTPLLDRCMTFILQTAWYVTCVLFALIALSRWITLTRPSQAPKVFKKRTLRILHFGPWIIIGAIHFSCGFLYPSPIGHYYPCLYTWGYDLVIPIGVYIHWYNFVFNTICAVIESSFNVLSLKWVHATRKSIHTFEATENRRREIKLLIQCALIGTVFTLANIMFTAVEAANLDTPSAYLALQIVWTTNHCINPVVYLAGNAKLRRNFFKLITGRLTNTQQVAMINVPPNETQGWT